MCCSPYRESVNAEHDCYSCGEPATFEVTGYDRCPTDRGDEVRETTEWFCRECLPESERDYSLDMNSGRYHTGRD